jgi:hypothetical protein
MKENMVNMLTAFVVALKDVLNAIVFVNDMTYIRAKNLLVMVFLIRK